MDELVKNGQMVVGDIVAIEDRRVRRRELSRARILTAALGIIDGDGLPACTMQRVATDLNVTPRALYRHVGNKEDLLRSVVEVVLSEMVLPDRTQPWIERVRQAGLELRRVLSAHPHAVLLCARRLSVFPAVIPVTDIVVDAFEEAGLPETEAIRFCHALFNYTLGFSLAKADYEIHAQYEPPLVDPLAGIDRSRVPHRPRKPISSSASSTTRNTRATSSMRLGLVFFLRD